LQNKEIQLVKERLKNSKNIVILTGAGISAESGVPTFRGKDGLWRNYDPMELATPAAFNNNPKLVWEWYNWRREIVSKTQPNQGHFALTQMEQRYKNTTIITQNVDGLHIKAGTEKVLEIHGNIWRTRCTVCGDINYNYTVPLTTIPPVCNKCKGILRPDIVWFGEQLPENIMSKVEEKIYNCDFMFVIGTSGTVQPAASFSFIAKQRNAYIVEINIEETPTTDIADISLLGKSGEILPKLI